MYMHRNVDFAATGSAIAEFFVHAVCGGERQKEITPARASNIQLYIVRCWPFTHSWETGCGIIGSGLR